MQAKSAATWGCLSAAVALLAGPAFAGTPGAGPPRPGPTAAARKSVAKAMARLPLTFEVNRGQTDRQVRYVARGSGYNLFLTAAEAVMVLREKANPSRERVLRLRTVGANPAPAVSGADPLPGRSSY